MAHAAVWAWRLDRESREAKLVRHRESRETKLVRVLREPKPVVAEARAPKFANVEVRVGGSKIAVELDREGLAAVLEVLRAALQVGAMTRPA